MPAHDQLRTAVDQCVEHLVNLRARDAEDVADAVRPDAFDHSLRAAD